MTPINASKDEYVLYFAQRISTKYDRETQALIDAGHGLSKLYAGKSDKIHRLIKVAFERGIRYGIGKVWEAHQPIVLRDNQIPGSAP